MSLPASQVADANLITGDGKVDLFKITLLSGATINLKADNNVTWQGLLWEGTAIQLTGTGQAADGELSRPKLTIANPDAIYSPMVRQGILDSATVVRYRVLYDDIVNNRNIFEKNTWRVRHIVSCNKLMLVVELRDILDGQFFMVPARVYCPPEFPAVSL